MRSAERDDPAAQPVPDADFEALLAPHLEVARLVALRMSARHGEDALQDALLRAWARRATFDPRRGTVRAWLLAIVANEVRRSAARDTSATSDRDEADRTSGPNNADLDLRRAVAALPDRQREAVGLYYYVDLTVADVAAAMGCSEGTVKATLSAARGTLRAVLQEGEPA